MRLISDKYRLFLYLLLFSGLGCFSYLFLANYADVPKEYRDTLTSLRSFVVVTLIFNLLGFSLVYVSERINQQVPSFLKNKKKVIVSLLAIALLLFALNYLMLICIKWAAGLSELFIMKAPGIRMILIVWLIELAIIGQIIIINFYRNLVTLYKKNNELKESATKAKYQALQNQLNPHFLFNNLNTLISEIEYNPVNASLFTRHLSDVYRYILQGNDQQTVSLQSELDFMHSYLFLHQVRLGDCVHVHNEVNPDLFNMHVPPLTLQLLVENVIKHNIISLTKPMTIEITFRESDAMLSVSNEIHTKKVLTPSGKGLQNLSERYRLLCGREIEIEKDNQYFTVKVPLLYE